MACCWARPPVAPPTSLPPSPRQLPYLAWPLARPAPHYPLQDFVLPSSGTPPGAHVFSPHHLLRSSSRNPVPIAGPTLFPTCVQPAPPP